MKRARGGVIKNGVQKLWSQIKFLKNYFHKIGRYKGNNYVQIREGFWLCNFLEDWTM